MTNDNEIVDTYNGLTIAKDNTESFSFKKLVPNEVRIAKAEQDRLPYGVAVVCENAGATINFMVGKLPPLSLKFGIDFLKTTTPKAAERVIDTFAEPIEKYVDRTSQYIATHADKAVTQHCYDRVWYDPKIIPPAPYNHVFTEPMRYSEFVEKRHQLLNTEVDMNDSLFLNHNVTDKKQQTIFIEPISESESLAEQKRILKQNLKRQGIKVEEQNLNNVNPIEVNHQLTLITTQLNELTEVERLREQNISAQERQNNLSNLSTEMIKMGQILDSKPLQVFGKVIELGTTIEKLETSFNSFGSQFTELGISALSGPIGLTLAAINIFLSFSFEPSAEVQYLEHITKQINELGREMTEMQQEIKEGFLGISKLQSQTFEILKNCLINLDKDMNGSIIGLSHNLTSEFENIQSTLNYLARFQHIAFHNQYLQPLHQLCAQTQTTKLKHATKAKYISDGLKTWIRDESKNKLLNGSIINQTDTTIEQKNTTLSKCLSFDEEGDQQLCSLIGFLLLRDDISNPLIASYANAHYLQHARYFYFLDFNANQEFINQMVGEFQTQKQILTEPSEEIWEECIADYYNALRTVKETLDECVKTNNLNRFEYYNRDYIEQAFYTGSDSNPQLNPDSFNLTQGISNFVNEFLNHSISHGNTTSPFHLVDEPTDAQQVPYPSKEINLKRLFVVLKQTTLENRRHLSKLWCLDFLKQASLSITTPSHFNEPNKIADSSDGKIRRFVRDGDETGAELMEVDYKIRINHHRHLEFTITSKLGPGLEKVLFRANNNKITKRLINRTIEAPIELKFTLKNGEENHVHLKFHTYGEGLIVEAAAKRENIQKQLMTLLSNQFEDLNQQVDCVEIRLEGTDSFQDRLEVVWKNERLLLVNKLKKLCSDVSHHNETKCFIDYKAALKKLAYASSKLKVRAYLHGFQLSEDLQVLTPEIIHQEINEAIETPANQALVLSPSLEQALAVDTRLTKDNFIKINTLSAYHPISLINNTQKSLIVFKSWLEYKRLTQSYMFRPFIEQTPTNILLNSLTAFREENYMVSEQILTQHFEKTKLRIDAPKILGINSSQEYTKCYKAISESIISRDKLHFIPRFKKNIHIDIEILERGWEVNFSYLICIIIDILQKNQIHSSLLFVHNNFPDYHLFFIACIYLKKLINFRKAFEFAKEQNLLEPQQNLLNEAFTIAKQFEKTIKAIALTEGLFAYLFDTYIENLKLLIPKDIHSTDIDIYEAFTNTNENEISPIQNNFKARKKSLLETELLIKNIIAMAFDERFSVLMEKFQKISLTQDDDFNNYLNPYGKADSLEQRLQQYVQMIEEIKKAVINHIAYNQNLDIFARYLLQNQNAPTLVIDTISLGKNAPGLHEEYIELLDQYLAYNTNLHSLTFRDFEINDEMLTLLVICIRKYSNIKHIGFCFTEFKANDLQIIIKLLPQLNSLNLSHNKLGSQGNDALLHLMNFIRQTAEYPQFAQLILNENEFNDNAYAVLNVAIEEISELKIIKNDEFETTPPREKTKKIFDLDIPISYGQFSLTLLIDDLEQEKQKYQQQIDNSKRGFISNILNAFGFYGEQDDAEQGDEITQSCTIC